MGCDSHGDGGESGWWLLWVVVASFYEFVVGKRSEERRVGKEC